MPARKVEVQPTRLEAVDSSIDPLGPLGEDASITIDTSVEEQAPTPPRKELSSRAVRPSSSASQTGFGRGTTDSVASGDSGVLEDRQKGPPPVQPAVAGPLRQGQPSMSIEQAAKPTFEITVGDPHKVGDLTTSHIVYQVRTKVRKWRRIRLVY